MNILVVGANGQLGRSIHDASRASENRFIFTDVTAGDEVIALDATDSSAVKHVVGSYDVDVIVNCAGYTDVNKAEAEEEMPRRLNAGLPAVLAEAAKEAGAVLIHISTDYVFDGKSSVPYVEDDVTSPLGVYGRTKLEGERAVADSGCRHIIIRTAWLYSCYGKNFFKTMEALTSSKPSVNVVMDQTGTPTYAPDLADAIMHIIENDMLGCQGIYNYSNEGVCSWYDFAKAICRGFGYMCDVDPCRSADFPSPVQRPSYSVLDKTLFKKTFGYVIPHWEDSLQFAICEYNKLLSNK
ncbi:MAG: dTDP-4-dehydrorhamnose reductase [Bacteroidales bacterium]|nr:dTDP-4-dehydrorhamnose reductase [Bacteroidales bacterium]